MTFISKHHLLPVILVIFRRRRRPENRKIGKKRIWVKIMIENRVELGPFSATFLLVKEFDRAYFFQ